MSEPLTPEVVEWVRASTPARRGPYRCRQRQAVEALDPPTHRGMTLRLERDPTGTGPRDRAGRHRWAKWLVLDDGEVVGIVVESREWLGDDDYGPTAYTAAIGETPHPWLSHGHASPAEALAALSEHLGGP